MSALDRFDVQEVAPDDDAFCAAGSCQDFAARHLEGKFSACCIASCSFSIRSIQKFNCRLTHQEFRKITVDLDLGYSAILPKASKPNQKNIFQS